METKSDLKVINEMLLEELNELKAFMYTDAIKLGALENTNKKFFMYFLNNGINPAIILKEGDNKNGNNK